MTEYLYCEAILNVDLDAGSVMIANWVKDCFFIGAFRTLVHAAIPLTAVIPVSLATKVRLDTT